MRPKTTAGKLPATPPDDVRDLEALLEHLDEAARRENHHLTVADLLAAVGARSFSPILLLSGTLVTSPLSGIPAMPTATACVVFLVSIQLLCGRRDFWLPGWLLRLHVGNQGLQTAVKWLRRPARFVDYFIQPRLGWLVRGIATRLIALLCLFVAALMPLMEFIPFSSTVAGAALTAFGLALVSNDGLFALLAYALVGATIGVVVYGHQHLF